VRVYRALPAAGTPLTIAALDSLAPQQLMTGFADEAGKPATVQTRAAVLADGSNLYLRLDCLEPNMDRLVAKCRKDDDAAIFQDDCLEVFISPTGGGAGYFHLVTNANGARYDEQGSGNASWSAPWTVRAERSSSAWHLTITVPWTSLGTRPARGSVWWLNLCRQRQAGGNLQLSAWSPTDSNFHDTARFGALVFDDAYGGYLAATYLGPWELRAAAARQRAKARASAARRLEAALRPTEVGLQALRAASRPIPLEQFGALLATGRAALKQLGQAEADLNETVAGVEKARAMARLARPGQSLLCWATTAITNRQVLPAPDPPRSLSRTLFLRACRGEYEPASFVVYPLQRAVTLQVTASDLRGPAGVIPASATDVRAVKCWYQAGPGERFPINRGLHLMTPELLLRDDDLVRVDTGRKRNYVKLQFPDGRRQWLDITTPEPSPEEKDSSAAVLPIRDAATLQRVTIPARTAKQFWVTVHVPSDARAGKYRGSIEITSGDNVAETLPLTLEVLPFDLAPNPLESSIYFHWGLELDMPGPGTLGIAKRSPAQLKAELQNLLAHGVDNPTVGVHVASGQLADELRLRQEVGMRNDRLYYLVGHTSTPLEKMQQIMATARGFGFGEFYFYGADEAQGDALKSQRLQWEQVHSIGGKVFVAGSAGQNFPLVGDLQDLLVCYGDPSRQEAANWHSKGHKVFCYANPQGGIEEPETYRRNFGLLLAVNDYDGGMTYIYYSGNPSWDDYCIPPYRQHNFVYPTVDGVIDTIQWEGYREGIDDLRYLGTLRQAIAGAQQTGGRAAAEAARAQAFLDKLDVTGDLYAVRDQMVRWIMRLRR
jgi:hypothetical protein